MLLHLNKDLITECDTGHTILDTEDIVVHCINAVKCVATRGSNSREFGIVDAGEVEGTSGLHLAQVETEWPCEGGEIFENVIWEIRAVHFGNDVCGDRLGCILEKSNTIDVERRLLKVNSESQSLPVALPETR